MQIPKTKETLVESILTGRYNVQRSSMAANYSPRKVAACPTFQVEL